MRLNQEKPHHDDGQTPQCLAQLLRLRIAPDQRQIDLDHESASHAIFETQRATMRLGHPPYDG